MKNILFNLLTILIISSCQNTSKEEELEKTISSAENNVSKLRDINDEIAQLINLKEKSATVNDTVNVRVLNSKVASLQVEFDSIEAVTYKLVHKAKLLKLEVNPTDK